MDSQRAKALLDRERERIERSLAGRKPQDTGELADQDQHPGDDASDLYQEELDESLRARLLRELEAVKRAEGRLGDGTYGLSVESGTPISDERLEVNPAAERTAEEQERFERGKR
jgi:RNA polymerase-binding transcription factor DksA